MRILQISNLNLDYVEKASLIVATLPRKPGGIAACSIFLPDAAAETVRRFVPRGIGSEFLHDRPLKVKTGVLRLVMQRTVSAIKLKYVLGVSGALAIR